jgi:hypothetical protein
MKLHSLIVTLILAMGATSSPGQVERTDYTARPSPTNANGGSPNGHDSTEVAVRATRVPANTPTFVDTLTCGQEVTKDDGATGTLNLRFVCMGGKNSINWGFTLSPQLKASITPEKEPVTEDGMAWWRNGRSQLKNSPHRRASTYQFHGNLAPVGIGEQIDYLDNISFTTHDGRHGNLTVAGTIHLRP